MRQQRKKKSVELDVYLNDALIGKLQKQSTGAVRFQYDAEWIHTDEAHGISLQLPLREEPYLGAIPTNFFDNLLPDNDEIRDRVASRVKAESSRTFDLLSVIGHDCVGALQFFPTGERPETPKKLMAELISRSEIASKIRKLKLSPLGLTFDEPKFRISIAGAQEKTAFLKQKERWYIPQGVTPTTHIFKPPMGIIHSGIDLTTSVENEWLCLEICRHLGLDVAKAEIEEFDDQKCLTVERFDREYVGRSKSVIRRLPQEDFCQSLGLPSTKKYQSDGGPTIKDAMELLNLSDDREKDRATFFRSQLIFFLLAATDGHAKNFSVFLTKTGFRMTPFYDVMSVYPAIAKKQLPRQRAKLAMSVGTSKHYKLDEIGLRHYEQTAKTTGFTKKELQTILNDLHAKVGQLSSKISAPKNFPPLILDSILGGVESQIKKLS